MKQKVRKRAKKTRNRKAWKKTVFLAVSFGISKDAHPEIYNFFGGKASMLLTKMKQTSCQLILERLKPLNLIYAHLNVSDKIIHQIFLWYCKTHKLKPYAAFTPKKKFSCKGSIKSQRLCEALDDYNLLFDLFFCDIQIKTRKLFIDGMNLFSNQLLVQAGSPPLLQFQKLLKRALPNTRFRLL